MKIGLYARCSTTKQDHESQVHSLKGWANKQGKDYILRTDYGSGKRYDRKGINEILELARNKEIDTLGILELSRIGRSITFIYKTIEELDKLRVKVILINSNTEVNPNTLEGRALLGGLALAADLEWQLLNERNQRAREKIKRDGIKLGRKRKKISIQAIKALQEKGMGYRGIAKELGTSPATVFRRLQSFKNGHLCNVSEIKEKVNGDEQNS